MTGTMRKRDRNVWEITVSLGKDANGVRRRQSRTVYGTKAKAQKRLRDFVQEIEQKRSRHGDVLVGDWLLIWYRDLVQPRLRIKTQERYADIIEQNLTPHLGNIPLEDLSPRHIDDAYRHLQQVDRYDPKTIRLFHCVLSGACKYAVRQEKVDRNVATLVVLPAVTKSEVIPPEIETVQHLLELAEAEDHPLFPFLFVLTYTGMRKGELWGLTWRYVDLAAGLIRVVEGTVRTKKQGNVTYRPKTDKGVRSIDLPEVAVDFLRDLRLHQGEAVKPDALVFPGADGNMMPETTMMRQLKELGARVGAPDITFHALRHFHASVCLEDDEYALATSRRLGHSSITTTMDVYGHLLKGRQKSLAQSFAKAMQRKDRPLP